MPKITMDDLRRSAEWTQDLNDPEIMAGAWRCGGDQSIVENEEQSCRTS